MERGEVVTALLFGGKSAQRRVVADKGSVVVICTEEEYVAAVMEHREPEGVGFPRCDVIARKPATAERERVEKRAEAGD